MNIPKPSIGRYKMHVLFVAILTSHAPTLSAASAAIIAAPINP